jgi:hypothetical protein
VKSVTPSKHSMGVEFTAEVTSSCSHLFYLNTHATESALANTNVDFSNVMDEGVRLGAARQDVLNSTALTVSNVTASASTGMILNVTAQ